MNLFYSLILIIYKEYDTMNIWNESSTIRYESGHELIDAHFYLYL